MIFRCWLFMESLTIWQQTIGYLSVKPPLQNFWWQPRDEKLILYPSVFWYKPINNIICEIGVLLKWQSEPSNRPWKLKNHRYPGSIAGMPQYQPVQKSNLAFNQNTCIFGTIVEMIKIKHPLFYQLNYCSMDPEGTLLREISFTDHGNRGPRSYGANRKLSRVASHFSK